MGYLRHECIVVSHWSAAQLLETHEHATFVFGARRMGNLVSGMHHHSVNGGAAFFIAPDGSKEGWEPSDEGDKARAEFIEYLRTTSCDWAHVLIGGDDGEYRVLASPADTPDTPPPDGTAYAEGR